ALFNLVHLVSRSVPVPARTPVELGALAVAVAAMARLGLVGAGWSAPRRPVAATVLTGLALYGFLPAGTADPVMPFMGCRGLGAAVVFASGHPSHAGVTTTLARLADNSETFGFGFAAPVLGRALIAIAVGAAVLGFLTRAAESDPM